MSVTLNVNNYQLSDCETTWEDPNTPDIAVTSDPTVAFRHQGTYSQRLNIGAGATAGMVAAYFDFPAPLNLTSATQVKMWIYPSEAVNSGDFKFLMDNNTACTSPLELIDIPALAADTLVEVTLTIATPANLTSVASIGIEYNNDIGIINFYFDDVRVDKISRTYSDSVLSVRGATDFDSIRKHPAVQRTLLDGSVRKVKQYFARNITVDLGVLSSFEDRMFLVPFVCEPSISITYDSETILVAVLNDEEFSNEWADGFENAKRYVLELTEQTVHTSGYRPSSWT